MNATLSPIAAQSQADLVSQLPTAFIILAQREAALAIAIHALVDLVEDGDFIAARKLTAAIDTRLQLLALTQKD